MCMAGFLEAKIRLPSTLLGLVPGSTFVESFCFPTGTSTSPRLIVSHVQTLDDDGVVECCRGGSEWDIEEISAARVVSSIFQSWLL